VGDSLQRHLQTDVPDTVFEPPRVRSTARKTSVLFGSVGGGVGVSSAGGGVGVGVGVGGGTTLPLSGAAVDDDKSSAAALGLGDEDNLFPRYCSFYSSALDTFGTVGRCSLDDAVAMVLSGLPITDTADKWLSEKKQVTPAGSTAAASASADSSKEDVFAWTSFAQVIPNFRVCVCLSLSLARSLSLSLSLSLSRWLLCECFCGVLRNRLIGCVCL
jgi:hypothetical protein